MTYLVIYIRYATIYWYSLHSIWTLPRQFTPPSPTHPHYSTLHQSLPSTPTPTHPVTIPPTAQPAHLYYSTIPNWIQLSALIWGNFLIELSLPEVILKKSHTKHLFSEPSRKKYCTKENSIRVISDFVALKSFFRLFLSLRKQRSWLAASS